MNGAISLGIFQVEITSFNVSIAVQRHSSNFLFVNQREHGSRSPGQVEHYNSTFLVHINWTQFCGDRSEDTRVVMLA